MRLHGARFIIIEFLIASIITAWVVIASIRYYSSKPIGVFGIIWILWFFGIFLNCIAVMFIAIRIRKREGNRPNPKKQIRMEWIALTVIVGLLVPFLLPYIAYRESLNQPTGR